MNDATKLPEVIYLDRRGPDVEPDKNTDAVWFGVEKKDHWAQVPYVRKPEDETPADSETKPLPFAKRFNGFTNVVVAVDFDGTCVTHEFPEVGRDVGAVPVLRRIVEEGGKLVLWTMRSGDSLAAAVNWFRSNEIPLFGIQCNPQQGTWTDSPKAYAHLYIDDAALGCPLTVANGVTRPFVDWEAVKVLIWGEE